MVPEQNGLRRRDFLRATMSATAFAGVPAFVATADDKSSGPRGAGRLNAGAAIADITPPLGVSMKGPIGGNGIVKSIHDPMHARCLALDNGHTRLAICVCDCTVIWRKSIEQAKKLVHQQTGLPIERMLISATHTHATPRMMGMSDTDLDKQYYDHFERRIAEAICRAIANLAPARIGWGSASKPEFVRRRRFRIEPGSNGPNPFGEMTDRAWMYAKPKTRIRPEGRVDPGLSILSVQHADGRPLAVLANYSIHYTSGYKRNEVSADYYPQFADQIEKLLEADESKPAFVGIMSNGNSGNIGPWHGGYEGMRKVGNSLAEEAFRVCQKMDYHDRVPIVMREEELELGVRRPDEKRIAWARQVLAGTWTKKAHHWKNVYVRNTLQLKDFPPTVRPKFQAVQIGNLGIASNPCEMYAETGLEIKQGSPLEVTFNIQLANGYNGYLPTPEQHELGGYSTWPAISSYLEVDASSKIRDHALKLLKEASAVV